MALDLGRFEAMTFDCYGTLIDWERGLLDALVGVAAGNASVLDPETALAAFARHESRLEAGPYASYREILTRVAHAIGAELGFPVSRQAAADFAASVGDWPPFADTREALRRLARRYRLGVITNCDDDLFARSRERLAIDFEMVVTAQQARAYKPDPRPFEMALERLDLPRQRVVHVAQSLFHDHVPVQALGLASVWVDRRSGRLGPGATPAATAEPDLVVTDLRSLADLADLAGMTHATEPSVG
jgi:2-haloacid dehalogenase